MSKRVKKSKYSFTLTGINTSKILHTYGIDIIDKIDEDKVGTPNTTKISDLNADKFTPSVVSFLDEAKRLHMCQICMIDFNSGMNVNLLRYHCYWCRHPFDTKPIGCPIKYVPSQIENTYHSNISRENYTIKENITVNTRKRLEVNKQDSVNSITEGINNIRVNVAEYYETDGVFCSFNCCKSWIDDNKHNRLYDHSMMLLMKMYNNMVGVTMLNIMPAPHWRLLEQYGGNLNIMKFRESFNKIEYECHGNTRKNPTFVPIGTMFEEKIKF
jgi:hypothetical protein